MSKKLKISDRTYFKKRFEIEKNKVLYDFYLKHLVNSIEKPDSSSIKNYYLENLDEKYLTKEEVVVSQIKLEKKSIADSLSKILSERPTFFNEVALKHSLFNSEGFGLMESFKKGQFNYLGETAFSMKVGAISGVIKNPDKSFSIIRVESKKEPFPVEIKKVYKRIESLLIKQRQDKIKTDTFNHFYTNKELYLNEVYSKHNY